MQHRNQRQSGRGLVTVSSNKEFLSVLSQRQFIGRLQDFAEATVAETQIPYLRLTRFCALYLEGLQQALEKAGYELPKVPHGAGSQGHRFTVAAILQKNRNATKEMREEIL